MSSPHRRLLTFAWAILLASTMAWVPAQAATSAATFVTPTPGLTTVLQSATSYTVSWSVTPGAGVTSTRIVTQTSRPLAKGGCDARWLPVGNSSVTGTSYQANGLLTNCCYRFLLKLTATSGNQTVTSPVLVQGAAGYGPVGDFTNPFLDGVVAYETVTRVGWAERDTFGSKIVARNLFEQSATSTGDSCAGVSWSAPVQLAFTGTSIDRTVSRSHCYRYLLTLQDAAGYRTEIVSGAMPVAASLPEWTGTVNLYQPNTFASQATNTWCVAASSQMMLNMILDQHDSSSSSQSTYITYAQAHDGGYYPAGSNPLGWAAVMSRYGGAKYIVQTFSSSASALKQAVIRMRQTNKPVGLLVWSGRHAWVLNGFSATADPATTSDFTITAVYVTGPLYPRTPNSLGYDQPPNMSLTPAQLNSYFKTYSDTVVRTWNGTYVVVMP